MATQLPRQDALFLCLPGSGIEKLTIPMAKELFVEWYKAYPRHEAPDAAERAYVKILRDGRATPEELMNGAVAFARFCREQRTEKKFIAHPATWLNAGRWKDDLQIAVTNRSAQADALARAAERFRGRLS
jgi:hypothetical protein